MGRTESQKANLQGVVDTAQSIAAAYDRNKALEAELKIIELQDEAYKQQLDAQQAVTQAQQKYADVLRSTIDNLQDFLKTLDGAATPTQNLRQARLDFKTVALRAADGDTSAYKDLTPAAKTFLDLSKNYSKTIQDYRRDEAAVRATLNAVIQVNQAELSKLPKEIARAADPTKEAWTDLQKALNKERLASIMSEALSVKAAESKRRLRTAEESLADRYIDTVRLLTEDDNYNLTKTFNNAVEDLIKTAELPDYSDFDLGDVWEAQINQTLPDYTAFDLGDVWDAQIKRVLPDSFLGQSFNAKEMMQAAIDKVMADIKTATTTTAPSLGSVTTTTGSQIPSDTTAPAWQNQPTPSGYGTSSTTATSLGSVTTTSGSQVPADTTGSGTGAFASNSWAGGGMSPAEIVKLYSSGTSVTDWFVRLPLSDIAGMFGSNVDTITSATKFTAMVKKYGDNPDLMKFMEASGVDMAHWMGNAGIWGKFKNYPGFAVGTTTATTPPPEVRWAQSILESSVVTIPKEGSLTEFARNWAALGNNIYHPVFAYAAFKGMHWDDVYNALNGTRLFVDNRDSFDSLASRLNIPRFEVGTNNVPSDMLAQIHKGEVIIPEAFNPERYSKATGNTALVEEIKALRAEVSRLREEQKAGQNAIAANTRKTAQALTKFDTDGMPETRS
jgi:hypothetical protein